MDPTRLSHYEIVERIGAGGMGEVFRARDTRLGREVAIKLLPPVFAHDAERLGRFKREAKLLAALNHANIATLHGLEEDGGRPFLVMELVEGDDLAQRLAKGRIPVREVLQIVRDVADALQTAHGQGIVHRDLKPANIKVTPEGKVKVLDFGLAKALETDPSVRDLTQSPTIATGVGTMGGVILGTAAYMSPEQARGKPVDKLTDVWSLGCVLYELLCGRPAFPGETVSDTIAKILEREPDWSQLPAETPAPIERLLRRCLQKDKTMRLQDVGEVRVEIDGALTGASSSWSAAAVAPPAAAARRRGRVLPWVIAAVAVVAAAVMGVVALRRPAPDAPVIRSAIPAPPGSRFVSNGDYAGPVVISPDGRRLAFVATDSTLSRLLFVRELDRSLARPLAGTDNATFPFWSPDGRSIGYFADGKLMRVELSGGLPITVCDAPNGRGGTWSKKGFILFAPAFRSGIFRVPDSGGDPAVVTVVDSTKFTTHRWPDIMPDGVHFTYIAANHDVSRSADYGVYFASAEGGEPHRLVQTGAGAIYGAGHLLFMRESTLMAVPFDPIHGTLEGTPRALVDKIQYDPTTWRASFSVSETGILVYNRAGQGLATRLLLLDRSGKDVSVIDQSKAYYNLALSPDGKKLAVTEGVGAGGTVDLDLWVYDIERHQRTRLTFNPGADVSPTWSPDGTRIAYATIFPGSLMKIQTLNVMQATGGGKQTLLKSTPGKTDEMWVSDWSRDGRFLIFSRGAFVGIASEVWAFPLTGNRKPFVVIPSGDTFSNAGKLSPDGRWIAYEEWTAGGQPTIFVSPFPPAWGIEGDPRSAGKWQIAEGGNLPKWKDDGTEIYFLRWDGKLEATSVDGSGKEFHVGGTHLLIQTDPWNFGGLGFDATPDGKYFAVNSFAHEASPPITMVQNWVSELRR